MGTRHEVRIPGGKALKRDALGTILFVRSTYGERIVRDTSSLGRGLGWLARLLAGRERVALERAAGIRGIPAVHAVDHEHLVRGYLPGAAMHLARFDSGPYFRDALRLLRQMHRRGIAHNDLAKEANWICMPGNRAGIVDFQLASISPQRRWLFRVLAREDLRHMLKHKRHYAPERLTQRQRRLLESPSMFARFWRRGFKPVYHLVTRRLLGWPERADARERQWNGIGTKSGADDEV